MEHLTESAVKPVEPKRKFSWFRLTPGRLLVLLLVIEGVLFLCDWFRWTPKGWAALISIAAVTLSIVLMLLWFAVALVFRWRFQFSVRSLMLLTVAVAVSCSWLAVKMRQAEARRYAIDSLNRVNCWVNYEYEGITEEPFEPKWMDDILGIDFFHDAFAVSYLDDVLGDEHIATISNLQEVVILHLNNTHLTDNGMKHLERMKKVQSFIINSSDITDKGLNYLKSMSSLKYLSLGEHTKVTDAGVAELQKALPKCKIER